MSNTFRYMRGKVYMILFVWMGNAQRGDLREKHIPEILVHIYREAPVYPCGYCLCPWVIHFQRVWYIFGDFYIPVSPSHAPR